MLVPGEEFAGYTILRAIGAGGMGEVYLAQHPRLPRREALKILRPDISNDETFQQRFIREADSIAALEHPHIVTVHDRGESEGRLWIATQYVDGTDAAKLLQDRYPAGMPADEAAVIVTAIAEALDYAHNRGLLHRDVKPANILLTDPDPNGNRLTYLADFGIARPLDDPSGLTSTNFTLGTFAFAAPEQLAGKPMDGRADQYALAATAFNLLTGTTVFPDSNPVAVISKHLSEPPPAPSTVNTDLASFDAAFATALAKNPDDRFAECKDFARALTDASREAGFSATAETRQRSVPLTESVAPSRPRRPLALTAVAAVVFLTAAGALLWHPWGKSDQSATPSSTAPPTSATATSATSSSSTTTSITTTAAPPPSVQTEPPLTRAASSPTVRLYDECQQVGATSRGADGTVYYCAQIAQTEGYVWSLSPRSAPNPYPRPGSTCDSPGDNSQNAVYGPVTCKASGNGTPTWQRGTSEQPAVRPPAVPLAPAYSSPWGPQPNEPCAVLGTRGFGSQGPVDCTQWVSGGVIIGQFWGPTPTGYGG